jgi:sirohydrochlorin ferrochelatase
MRATHLLIIAHGSRREASNDEVRRLAARVRERCTPAIGHVEVAFLELAEPSIAEGLARCVAKGAQEIVVLPFFLAAGTHVALDIPEAIANFELDYPDLRIRLTPHLGASEALPDAILSVALAELETKRPIATNPTPVP